MSARLRRAAADPGAASRAIARRGLARIGRGTVGRAIDSTPFATFVRDDGGTLALWSGYRDAIKSRWRDFWWPTMALYRLRDAGVATSELDELRAELDAARTLPVPLREIAAAVSRAVADRPGVAVLDGAVDLVLGLPRIDVELTPQSVAQSAAMYTIAAGNILDLLRRHGPLPARALEIGCGTGGMGRALAAAGVAEVLATDLEPPGFVRHLECEAIRERLLEDAAARGGAGTCTLAVADAMRLDLPDASFDLVYSVSALEHVRDPVAAFREIARVLTPGGLSYHGIDPWFGPQGGHSLCTLDVPWGHARLSEGEFRRYVEEVRPHEAAFADDFYDAAFQRPRLSSAELRRGAEAAGLEVVSWRPQLGYPEHRRWLGDALAEIRAGNPSVGKSDLLASGIAILLRKR